MFVPRPALLFLLAVCGVSLGSGWAEDFQGSTHPMLIDEAPLQYSSGVPDDPIARLQARLDRKEQKLKFDNERGWLPGVLEALGIPATSQSLVFSKTSLQRQYISPGNPRALYFNDDVYVGYVPGAPVMEISAVDPKLGGVFYTIEQLPARKPKFVRDGDCLRCHSTARSMGVPGHVLRSVATDESGELDATNEFGPVEHCTPLERRWAGWYVTGTHGGQPHLGNLVGAPEFTKQRAEPLWRGNVRELGAFIDARNYPEPGSDIVALMVLEHQAHMHNYITRLNYETQVMMASYGHIRYLSKQVEAFLRYLLFVEEVPLRARVAGDARFTRAFAGMGPWDKRGRSLRDFDLETRLFRYPCSFLIYSEAFDALPEVMREEVLRRLWEILTGKDESKEFARLTGEQRREVLEILRETKYSLPGYWREPVEGVTGVRSAGR